MCPRQNWKTFRSRFRRRWSNRLQPDPACFKIKECIVQGNHLSIHDCAFGQLFESFD